MDDNETQLEESRPLHQTASVVGTIQEPTPLHLHLQNGMNGTSWSHWKILVFGQLIAFIAASANACSYSLITNLNVSLPMTELCLVYAVLALMYKDCLYQHDPVKQTPPLQIQHDLPFTRIKLHVPWWVYFCVSFLDVGANFITIMSFHFTSLTSTSLLGSLTIPSVMIVSCALLKRVFRLPHYVGVALCLVGATMTVWLDVDQSMRSAPGSQTHSYIGDLLAILAALLYGLGDSLAEYSIKHLDRREYLFMIGLFGAILTAIQVPILEGSELYALAFKMSTSTQLVACVGIAFYVAALVAFYIFLTLFLAQGDATLLVLSLQATQFWAILFSVVAEHHAPTPWFMLAVVLVVSGVFCYEICGGQSPTTQESPVHDVEETSLLQDETINYSATA